MMEILSLEINWLMTESALVVGGVLCVRVATKIFEGYGEALFMKFIKGREPVSIIYYARPGSSIKWPIPKKLKNHGSNISGRPPKSSKNLRCNSDTQH